MNEYLLNFLWIYSILSMVTFVNTNKDSYGEFSASISNFRLCQGPKKLDCVDWNVTIEDYTVLRMNSVVKDVVKQLRGKILASVNGKQILRLQMSDPCDHIFLKPLFQNMFNMTEDCKILKGNYSAKVDMMSMANKYFGGKFLLEEVTFKSYYYNDKCNFICCLLTMIFK